MRSKYNNRPVLVDGIRFDSMMEARRYSELKLLERGGKIRNLELQPSFIIHDDFTAFDGTKVRAITYRADFSYFEGEKRIVEDVKGHRTSVYSLKKKLFLSRYPDIIFRET